MQVSGLIAKSIRNPGKAASTAIHTLLAPIGHLNFRRFMVLTRSRTGSNMLVQSLDSHPNISSDYEVFTRLNGRTEVEILQRTFAKQPFYIKAKGFKIFYSHPWDTRTSTVWDELEAMKELHVIHLKRRNLLHTLVSFNVADRTDVYGVRTEREQAEFKRKISPFAFNVDQLRQGFEKTREWQRAGAERFKSHPMIEVYYEDLVAQSQQEFTRIVNFLALDYRPLKTDFRKQRTESMRQLVTNYDELKVAFEGTEWERMFDE